MNMGYSEEWEAQQQANRLIEERQSGNTQNERSKYETVQPQVFKTQQSVAEFLIVKGVGTFKGVEQPADKYVFVFAASGDEPAKTAKLFEAGELTFDNDARTEAARNYAKDRINAAISDYRHMQNTR